MTNQSMLSEGKEMASKLLFYAVIYYVDLPLGFFGFLALLPIDIDRKRCRHI